MLTRLPDQHWSIEEWVDTMNDETSLLVSEKSRKGVLVPIGWWRFIIVPLVGFVRAYFFQRHYKRGLQGFISGAFGAVYNLAFVAKRWEYHLRMLEGKGNLPPMTVDSLKVYKRR